MVMVVVGVVVVVVIVVAVVMVVVVGGVVVVVIVVFVVVFVVVVVMVGVVVVIVLALIVVVAEFIVEIVVPVPLLVVVGDIKTGVIALWAKMRKKILIWLGMIFFTYGLPGSVEPNVGCPDISLVVVDVVVVVFPLLDVIITTGTVMPVETIRTKIPPIAFPLLDNLEGFLVGTSC